MINTSNEYNRQIMNERKFILKATVTLLDSTVLNLTDADIMQGEMSFEDEVSGSGTFQIGAAIINKNRIMIDNSEGKFDSYDFTGATVVPYVGLQLSETVESLKKGFYTVDEPNTIGSFIALESLDNMHKFEKPFSEVSQTFPCTSLRLLQIICLHCGVPLGTVSFTNSGYVVSERPDDKAMSCLDMVSHIAQISGNFARCNIDGALELKWYDFGVFEDVDAEEKADGGVFDNGITWDLYKNKTWEDLNIL